MPTLNDSIPPRHTLQHPIQDVSGFLRCTDRQIILSTLQDIDTERIQLECGLRRLTAQNRFLRNGQDVCLPDEYVLPIVAERYSEEQTQNMDLASLRNLTLSMYMTNRTMVREQHEQRNLNDYLRRHLDMIRQRRVATAGQSGPATQ
ncbi:MAG: hypothetical protein Q9219_005331 [cf. Caloplaca sp. 3 TL-2023]